MLGVRILASSERRSLNVLSGGSNKPLKLARCEPPSTNGWCHSAATMLVRSAQNRGC